VARVAQPAFHRQRLAGMAASMTDTTDAMLECWEQYAGRGGEFDLSAETSRLALDVIGRTLLGEDLRDQAEGLGQAMVDVFRYFNDALNHFAVAPRFIPTAHNRALRRALRAIDRLVNRVIERRRAKSAGGRDAICSRCCWNRMAATVFTESSCATTS
jgi:cytochrome P450